MSTCSGARDLAGPQRRKRLGARPFAGGLARAPGGRCRLGAGACPMAAGIGAPLTVARRIHALTRAIIDTSAVLLCRSAADGRRRHAERAAAGSAASCYDGRA